VRFCLFIHSETSQQTNPINQKGRRFPPAIVGGSAGGDGGTLALNGHPNLGNRSAMKRGKPAFNWRVYDEAGNVIETQEQAADFKEW